jgi:hypothetical protein
MWVANGKKGWPVKKGKLVAEDGTHLATPHHGNNGNARRSFGLGAVRNPPGEPLQIAVSAN